MARQVYPPLRRFFPEKGLTRRQLVYGVAIGLLIAVVGFSGLRYLLDRYHYERAQRAYQQADCAAALEHFDSILESWRINDLGEYLGRALEGQEECLAFQSAVERQQEMEFSPALVAYSEYIDRYSDSLLADVARERIALFIQADPFAIASLETCAILDPLLERDLFPSPAIYLPPFYLACGQVYDSGNRAQFSFNMYAALLREYPDHPLAEMAVAALLANPTSCYEYEALQQTARADRAEFMPTLLFQCGQTFQSNTEWDEAIGVYEFFVANYPDHDLSQEVETGLALSIVARAQLAGAGEIPAPEASGQIAGELSEVVIQNDSPERLRIVFSGPEARVEELPACASCQTYTIVTPSFCPERGPIGRYTLAPGQYDVVVETVMETGTTPWAGSWSLQSGEGYSSCFFIVTTLIP